MRFSHAAIKVQCLSGPECAYIMMTACRLTRILCLRFAIQCVSLMCSMMLILSLACNAVRSDEFAWREHSTGSEASLRGLAVAEMKDGSSVYWVTGAKRTVRLSLDGENWSDRSPTGYPDELEFRSIHAWDAQRAIIASAGSPAVVLLTENGGESWTEVYRDDREKAFFDGLRFLDDRRGVLFGDPVQGHFEVFTTIDAGRTWQSIDAASLPPTLPDEAAFAASNSAMIVVPPETILIGSGGSSLPSSRIHRSRDFGKSWSVTRCEIPSGATNGIFSITTNLQHGDNARVIAVGGDYRPEVTERGASAVSQGGGSFAASTVMPAAYRSSVVYSTGNENTRAGYYACGPTGTDWSADGSQWIKISPIGFHALATTKRGDLVAVGSKGRFGTTNRVKASWKAGTAKAIITPQTPVWLAGYGTKRVPDGKLHDLWLKVLALEDHRGQRVVLITSDFQGVPKQMSDRVFDKLKQEFGLDRSQIMFTFSHNHCGPRLGDDLLDYYPVESEQEALVAEYTAQMIELCCTTVRSAMKDMRTARLAQGVGQATFAVNRRNNKEADVAGRLAGGRALAGPVDHDVPVLRVANADGSIMAIVFGYACHPTTLSFTKWCGDYPGFAQIEIEQSYPGAQAMFVNTCGGDQNPLPRRTVELCESYGHRLAEGVRNVLSAPMQPIGDGLQVGFELAPLAYLEVTSRETLQPLVNDANAIRARWASRMLRRLDAGEKFEAEYPYPIHAWRLGQEMLMIGTGAETVVDYAINYKRQYGWGTWVCGYSDDMISYIPSRRVWEEGGYEGGSNLYEYGRPAFRWSGDIQQRIDAAVKRQVEKVSQATSP